MGGRTHGVKDLEARLLAAHEHGQGPELARLYAQAAAHYGSDPERAAFYLTHAYVFALEAGMPEAAAYHQQLKSQGREE